MIIIADDRELKRNASGYIDSTPYEVLKKEQKEDTEFHRLLHTIFYICELAGFEIDGRIVLINKKSGRIWR